MQILRAVRAPRESCRQAGERTLNGKTKVVGNFASTSNSDIYGTY